MRVGIGIHKGFESEKVTKRTFKSPQKSKRQKKGILKMLKKVNVPKGASNSNKVTQKSAQKVNWLKKVLKKSLKKVHLLKKNT